MILGVVKRILKEDLNKVETVPKWVDALLAPLNDFIEKVGLALQNRLTFKHNFLGKEVSLKFTHDVQLEINPYPNNQRGALSVSGCIPISTGEVFIEAYKWIRMQNGNIGVTIRFSGATEATVKLQIQLE